MARSTRTILAALTAFAALATSQAALAAADSKAVVDFNSCAKPQYPADSIKAKQEGTVTLKFKVGADGAVQESAIDKSSGHPALDEAARDAIKLCKFVPAKKKGKAVAESVQVQYVWTLK